MMGAVTRERRRYAIRVTLGAAKVVALLAATGCSTTIINNVVSGGGADGGRDAALGALPDGALVECSRALDDAGVPMAADPFARCCAGVPTQQDSSQCKADYGPCTACESTQGALPNAGPGPLCKRGSNCTYDPSAGTDAGWTRTNPNTEGTCHEACVNAGFTDCSCYLGLGNCLCYP
jgi:hypothetical protein